MTTYPGSHVAQFTAEQGEDMILQHELHLVLINFFLSKEGKKKKNISEGSQTQFTTLILNVWKEAS